MSAAPVIMVDKPGLLYAKMREAVDTCYSIDDCAEIAKQGAAVAAYFKQINDDETMRKFLAVKLRAWRRIGEILLTVDDTGCASISDHIRKIHKQIPEAKNINDSFIRNALKLGRLPEDSFEREAEKGSTTYQAISAYEKFTREAWEATPEGRAEAVANRKLAAEAAQRTAEWERQQAEQRAEQQQTAQEQRDDLAALAAARAEVGFTMDRRDRKSMKEVVFMIKAPIHETLRKAAFDRHVTMQLILRSGLFMWFVANGYNINAADLDIGQPTLKPPRAPR